jgi:hypothetical protein
MRATRRFYTAGYANLTLPEFKQSVERLNAVVFDIRFNPTSKHQDWGQSKLKRELRDRYRHCAALGNKNYLDHTKPIEIADLRLGLEIILKETAPVILLCGCASRLLCHRLSVANELQVLGFYVVELELSA